MLSSRFAGIPISSSIIDGSGLPQLLIRGEQTATAVTGSGGRLHFGMVAGIKSEWWPASNRNPRPACVGIRIHLGGFDQRGVDSPVFSAVVRSTGGERVFSFSVRF